jgi:hypothetical protein
LATGPEETSFMLTETSNSIGTKNISSYLIKYPYYILFFYYWWGGTKSLGTAATSGLLYKPQMIDEDDCGAIGGIRIGRGK